METQKVTQPFHNDVGAVGQETQTKAYMDQVTAVIRDSGWAMQAVPASSSGNGFDYVYTIGLVVRNCTAELMVVGLPFQQGAEIINQIALNMLNHAQLIPPDEWPLANGFVLKSKLFVPKVGGELHVGVARAFYGQDIVVAQYVWPDEERRYPWDEGWDPKLVQPVGNR